MNNKRLGFLFIAPDCDGENFEFSFWKGVIPPATNSKTGNATILVHLPENSLAHLAPSPPLPHSPRTGHDLRNYYWLRLGMFAIKLIYGAIRHYVPASVERGR